jgi:hypothetical protein
MRCGLWTHKTAICRNENPDCNEDSGDFNLSNKGKRWWQDRKLGPFVHQRLDPSGRTYKKTEPAGQQRQGKCEYSPLLLTSITQDVLNVTSPILDYKYYSDFLSMTISLPPFQQWQRQENCQEPRERTRIEATQVA